MDWIFSQDKAKISKKCSFEHGCSYFVKPMDGRERLSRSK